MSKNIKTLRENLELTQEQVSILTGVPVKTLRNWEQEIRKPSEWTIDLIMDRLLRMKMEEYSLETDSPFILSFLTIKESVIAVAKEFDVQKVYLFGSYAKGEAREDSDVDLYMESNLFGLDYFGFAEALREKLVKKVELLSDKTIQSKSLIEQEIMRTGILIYERS
ncbi:MAG: nucleotidyltransferase domain-containing protein [Bacilli bacterium]|nr:nucleotidyltransferase domain-containing protein [Bacilli bacterium]MBN2876157.1 nucleotidyltransferase domain-containing protein [Bacilli bacterium]